MDRRGDQLLAGAGRPEDEHRRVKHGDPRRKVERLTNGGLYLQDEHGHPRCVTADALKRIVETAATCARVIVLNTCYSGLHGDMLCDVVDCVIGMTGAISDCAARAFAVGFYRALGYRRSGGNAVDQAVAGLQASLLCDVDPTHRTARQGIDLQQVFLT